MYQDNLTQQVFPATQEDMLRPLTALRPQQLPPDQTMTQDTDQQSSTTMTAPATINPTPANIQRPPLSLPPLSATGTRPPSPVSSSAAASYSSTSSPPPSAAVPTPPANPPASAPTNPSTPATSASPPAPSPANPPAFAPANPPTPATSAHPPAPAPANTPASAPANPPTPATSTNPQAPSPTVTLAPASSLAIPLAPSPSPANPSTPFDPASSSTNPSAQTPASLPTSTATAGPPALAPAQSNSSAPAADSQLGIIPHYLINNNNGNTYVQPITYINVPPNMLFPWNLHSLCPYKNNNRQGLPYPIMPLIESVKFDHPFQGMMSTNNMSTYVKTLHQNSHPIADLYGMTLTIVKNMFIGGSHAYSTNSIAQRMSDLNANIQFSQHPCWVYDRDILTAGIDPFLMRDSISPLIYNTNGPDPVEHIPPTNLTYYIIGHNKILTVPSLTPLHLPTFMHRHIIKSSLPKKEPLINMLQTLQDICYNSTFPTDPTTPRTPDGINLNGFHLWTLCRYANQRIRHTTRSLYVVAIQLFCALLQHLHPIWLDDLMGCSDPISKPPTGGDRPPSANKSDHPITQDVLPNRIAHNICFDHDLVEQVKTWSDTYLYKAINRHIVLSTTIARLLRQLVSHYNLLNFLLSCSLTSLINEHNNNNLFPNQQINIEPSETSKDVIPAYLSQIADVHWEQQKNKAYIDTQPLINAVCLQILHPDHLQLPYISELWDLKLHPAAPTCASIRITLENRKREIATQNYKPPVTVTTATTVTTITQPLPYVSSATMSLLAHIRETSSMRAGGAADKPPPPPAPTSNPSRGLSFTSPGSVTSSPADSRSTHQVSTNSPTHLPIIPSPSQSTTSMNTLSSILPSSTFTDRRPDAIPTRPQTEAIRPGTRRELLGSDRPLPRTSTVAVSARTRTPNPGAYVFYTENRETIPIEIAEITNTARPVAPPPQVNKLNPSTIAKFTNGISNLGVNNISTYTATEDELHILALGANFIFEPSDISDIEIWDAYDEFATTLSHKETDFFHNQAHDRNSIVSRLRAKLYSKKQQARKTTYDRISRTSYQDNQQNNQLGNLSPIEGSTPSIASTTSTRITNQIANPLTKKRKFSCDQPDTNEYLTKVKQALTKALASRPKPPTHRLSETESKDIKAILYSLKHNQLIVIKPADKNLGLTIMDRKWYIDAGELILQDTNSYTQIASVNVRVLRNELIEIFVKAKEITLADPHLDLYSNEILQMDLGTFSNLHIKSSSSLAYTSLEPFMNEEEIKACRMYFLPKIHKMAEPIVIPPPLIPGKSSVRPICASNGWITYNVSTYLDILLQPLAQKIPTYIKDSNSVIKLLEDKTFPPDFAFLAADVESLYPSIDIEEGLQALERQMLQAHWSYGKIELTLQLTRWVLRNNVVEFNGKQYLQIRDTAMGTPCAVVFACLFMAHLEIQITKDLAHEGYPTPILNLRFIDDYLIVCRTEQQCQYILQRLNRHRKNISVTGKISQQEAIFLDLLIYKGPRLTESQRLDIRLYEKPTNKFLYLPGTSYHPLHVNRGWIQTEIIRRVLRNTETLPYLQDIRNLRTRLKARGHNLDLFHDIFNLRYNRPLLIKNINPQPIEKDRNTPTPTVVKLRSTPRTSAILPTLKEAFTTNQQHLQNPSIKSQLQGKLRPLFCHKNDWNIRKTLVTAKLSTPNQNTYNEAITNNTNNNNDNNSDRTGTTTTFTSQPAIRQSHSTSTRTHVHFS